MMYTLEAATLAIWVSVFTLGISNASEKGALLYPIMEWLLKSDNEKRHKLQIQIETLRKQGFDLQRNQQSDALIKAEMQRIEKEIMKIGHWKKPFFTCPKCMPSIWTTVFFFLSLPKFDWLQLPFAILLSSLINTWWIKTVNR